jgi:hypothetical protein
MGHGKYLGSFDGPPIFLYVYGWATKQANDAIEASTLFYTTTRSGRITTNTTNWRAAQIVIGDECVGQAWWNYVCQCSASVYLQSSYLQVFLL